ncbi:MULTISPECIES: FAD binding domain-containing protein [unclassified Brevibacterium]|uniref:FAD binding domain-containing protein n=1 Tax=unclassified Brevibacterium TaxID=2614124 RepID=UPI001E608484|nr:MULTISPECIES: FAD binding domain-containing protein [unclassified Brevibacterium]MCD1286431.1 FAD-binding molybdopterin dehydrogenase [Brevibacterium sp. CCUG 69071]MDK8433800.1 FAD binding domain-containing protein [Brevibacterium sp. H-BE7]
MDMTCVDEVLSCADPDSWRPGDSWLAGGTVLFSYGTDITRGAPTRLLDITEAGWEPTRWNTCDSRVGKVDGRVGELEIAATCRIAEIYGFASAGNLPQPSSAVPNSELPGLDLFAPCCDSFVASWKIWNASTIGGNVATALPAGPMISLLAGLDATALLLGPSGSRRSLPVADLVLGEARTALCEGELIRSFHLDIATLRQPCAFRRISLTERGRSAALLIGRLLDDGRIRLTLTASTKRPHIVELGDDANHPATSAGLHAAIDAAVEGNWHDDIHGSPRWREAMTHRLGEEILGELLAWQTIPNRTGDISMTRRPA